MRNFDILSEHAQHPGWSADGCEARITVTPSYGAPVGHGFACAVTGGHCLPGIGCDALRAEWAAGAKDREIHARHLAALEAMNYNIVVEG